jgi:hypothetical protein
MSVDFANGSRPTLGDPGEESRRVATFSCPLLVRAFVEGNASRAPRFRQSASSPLAAGSSFVATRRGNRNLAGRRFSATARSRPRHPGWLGRPKLSVWSNRWYWPVSTPSGLIRKREWPSLILVAYIRAMGHIDTCLGILRRLIAKGDVNGIPLAKRAINEYWDAAPVQARESGLRFVQQDVLNQRNAVTGDHRNLADTVNAYIEKKLAANRAAKRPT